MIYKSITKFSKSAIAGLFVLLGVMSCYDSGFEEFVAPTGNVNNIQPNTLFTTTTDATDNLSLVFRSFSTDAVSYLWDFGDGNTSTEADPDYTYCAGGFYTVVLTTTSSDGLIAVDSSSVAPIFADFDFSTEDTEVDFNNLSTGASSLVWDFGDGDTVEWDAEDTEEDASFSPTHIYTEASDFDVTLTATSFLGVEVSVTKAVSGLVLSTIPDFTFAVSGFTVDFTDASILAVSHSWDFGDGNTSTEASPTNTFPGEGTYEVTLTTTNDVGVSKSTTKSVPIGGIEATFKAIVQNGTADDHQVTTGDNSDAWDMTPNSTVIDDVLGEIASPYAALWKNQDLADWLEVNCGDADEQPGSTSDGNKFAGLGDRGVKINEACRRLYQAVEVEVGVEYTFTIDSRSEAAGVNSEVYILNNEIVSEDAINTEAMRTINADAYLLIDNDFNSSKSSTSDDTFTTNTFTFTPTASPIVIYVRASAAVDSSNEVFYDNIDIITPGFGSDGTPAGVTATFAAVIQNGTADDHQVTTGDNSDAWDMTPNSTVIDDVLGEIASPYAAIWKNQDLADWLEVNCGDADEQPGSTGDGNKFAGLGDRGVKLNESCRRLYQVLTVEVGVEYTFTIDSRSEAAGVNSEVYILNNEIISEDAINTEAMRDINADAYYLIDNDFNSSKASTSDDTFTTSTFTFIPTTTTIVVYVRSLDAVDSSNEVFYDNIDIITPGF